MQTAVTAPQAFRRAVAQVLSALRSYVLGPWRLSEMTPEQLGGYGRTAAGVTVTEQTALNLSAVWCAVQIIAGGLGAMPLVLYKRTGNDGRERYHEHPLYTLLHDAPNPEMSSMVFRETLQQHVLLWGNGYAQIVRDQGGRVRRLELITPNRVAIKRTPDGALYYDVANSSGRGPSQFSPSEMFHIQNISFDGICGYSTVRHMRETLALTMAAEQFGATFFGNKATASGILRHPRGLLPETRKALAAQLEAFRAGGSHGTLILEEGMDWTQTTIPPDDAQFLATRELQVEEIARAFNVPPHKLKDLRRATFSNISHQALEFLSDTMRPWMKKWEQEISRKLIAPSERQIQYVEHLIDDQYSVDITTRYNAYKVGHETGFLTARQICARENLNPPPDDIADKYYMPANMVDLTAPAAPTGAQDVGGPGVTPFAEPVSSNGATPARALERAEDPRRRALIITSLRALVADAVRRLAARERDKVRSAAKAPERLAAWCEEFYPRHCEVLARALVPATTAVCAWVEAPEEPEQIARAYAAAWCEDSARQLRALLAEGPGDVGQAVEELFTRWDVERLGAIPDAVMGEMMRYVA